MIAKAKPERFEDEGRDGTGVSGMGDGEGLGDGAGKVMDAGGGVSDSEGVIQDEAKKMKQESCDVREDDPLMHCSTDEHPEMWPGQYDGPAGPEPLVDAGELWEMFGKAADEMAGVDAEFDEGCGCDDGGEVYEKAKVEKHGGETKHELEPAVVCPMCNVAGEEKNQAFYCPKCGNLLQGCCD